jgi:type VI secretion system protein ImpA
LSQSEIECQQLIRVVDEKFGSQAPSLLGIRKAIEDCRSLVETIVKEKRRLDPSYRVEEASSEVDIAANVDVPVNVVAGGSLSREPASREDAFQRLAVIAEYLKRKEPQNPVSYLVERAVRWSKMPLEQWLGEVVQNDEVLLRLRDTLGIKGPEET